MKKKALTLTELLIIVALLGLSISFISALFFGSCSGGPLFTNPYMSSESRIVIVSKEMVGKTEGGGTFYNIYGYVLSGESGYASDDGFESFEISDSYLDGNLRSRDIYNQLQVKQIYDCTFRGERNGYYSSFRKVTGATYVPVDQLNVSESKLWNACPSCQ